MDLLETLQEKLSNMYVVTLPAVTVLSVSISFSLVSKSGVCST